MPGAAQPGAVALAALILALIGGGTASAQDGPHTAQALPPDTRLLRVHNASQVDRMHQQAIQEVMPTVGLAGQSLVEVIIGPDGRVEEARLVRSSGSNVMDAEAVKIGRIVRFSSVREIHRPAWVKFQLRFQWKPVPVRRWPPPDPRGS